MRMNILWRLWLVFRFVRVLVRMPLQRRPPIRFDLFQTVCIDAQRFVVRDVIVRLAVAAPCGVRLVRSFSYVRLLSSCSSARYADHVLKIMTTTYRQWTMCSGLFASD